MWGDASLHRGLPNWAARGASQGSSCPITQLRRKDDDVIRKGQKDVTMSRFWVYDDTFLGNRVLVEVTNEVVGGDGVRTWMDKSHQWSANVNQYRQARQEL